MSHALDEAIDSLNHRHLVDCAAVEGGDCNCEELEDACAA